MYERIVHCNSTCSNTLTNVLVNPLVDFASARMSECRRSSCSKALILVEKRSSLQRQRRAGGCVDSERVSE